MDFHEDQRKTYTLSESQLVEIAERGAHAAFEKMTTRIFVFVGRGLIERIFWFVGIAAFALYLWLQSKGLIK
jgi:hypothetical protein